MLFRKSHVLPHISILPQNTCFIANHRIIVNRPFITFIAIAPSHYRFVAYHLSLADAILLSHRPMITPSHYRSFTSSLLYIIAIPYRIAHRAIIKAFIPYHRPMRSPNVISLSHIAITPIIYKVPCPLALR